MKLDYRVWDKDNKKFYYNEKHVGRDAELFTGYYDNFGNKIYVGDIIECLTFREQYMGDDEHTDVFYEVICFDFELGFYSKSTDGGCGYFFEYHRNETDKVIEDGKVIGNIHENNELLKRNTK